MAGWSLSLLHDMKNEPANNSNSTQESRVPSCVQQDIRACFPEETLRNQNFPLQIRTWKSQDHLVNSQLHPHGRFSKLAMSSALWLLEAKTYPQDVRPAAAHQVGASSTAFFVALCLPLHSPTAWCLPPTAGTFLAASRALFCGSSRGRH